VKNSPKKRPGAVPGTPTKRESPPKSKGAIDKKSFEKGKNRNENETEPVREALGVKRRGGLGKVEKERAG